jgi:tight adherence protein B
VDNLMLTFAIAGFLAVVLLLEGGYLLWNSYRGGEAVRLQTRLRQITGDERDAARSAVLKERRLSALPQLQKLLAGVQVAHALDRFLQQTGLEQTVGGLIAWTAAGAAGALCIWFASPAPGVVALPCIVFGGALPWLRALRARKKRLGAIEQQLPDALDLMSRALRAGHAFPSALQMVANEGPQPIAAEFRVTFDEINYGVPTQDALSKLARRVPIADLRFFVIAVAIQRETGGNLTEILDKLSSIVRARFKLLATARVLSAEGRLSAWILAALPFVLITLINLINPTFMSKLWTDPAGLYAIWAGAIFIAIGLFWMWRITKLKV